MEYGKWIESLDQRWYPELSDNWDDALFRERVLHKLSSTSRMLDLGAGAGIVQQMNFRSSAAQVCGIDLDPRVLENPYLHEARIGSAEKIPYEDEAFDVVIADNVLEHLRFPEKVFREVGRVLRPGGWFLAKTPNRWHYMPILARVTPYRFHRLINQMRGRMSDDTFPTLYRANSLAQIRRLVRSSGLTLEAIEHIEGRPEYLRMTPITYAAGYLYERVVNWSEALRWLRVVLVVHVRKAM